jgi:hypothetical protein
MIRPVCVWPGLGLFGPCYSTPIPIPTPTPTPIHTFTYSHTRIPVGLRHDLRRGGDAVALPARCASTPHTLYAFLLSGRRPRKKGNRVGAKHRVDGVPAEEKS